MSPETEIPTKRSKPHISLLLATWFGVGYLPKAPGTWGSAAAVALAMLSSWRLDLYVDHRMGVLHPSPFFTTSYYTLNIQVLAAFMISVIGVIVANRAARYAQIEDPQWVVIDEVSGQLITYYLFFFFWDSPLNWKSWLLGFILFRIFDIWKPFPARQLERLPGGWGIMADDWMAGIYAAIALRVALHFRVL